MAFRTSKSAVITGASSGIGAAFAQRLAEDGYDLILVARHRERLAALASELEQWYGIAAEVIAADLSCPHSIEQVETRIGCLDNLDMLVNSAGFGTLCRFAEGPLEKHLGMIQVHILASTRLCHAALPGMLKRGRGAIINVSSVGAFTPGARNVVYCATKAYLVTFSEALHGELKSTGVRVQALCPGFTLTEFHDTPEYAGLGFDRSDIPAMLWSSPEDVVTESLKALARGQVVCILGFTNRLLVSIGRTSLGRSLLRMVAGPSVRRATS